MKIATFLTQHTGAKEMWLDTKKKLKCEQKATSFVKSFLSTFGRCVHRQTPPPPTRVPLAPPPSSLCLYLKSYIPSGNFQIKKQISSIKYGWKYLRSGGRVTVVPVHPSFGPHLSLYQMFIE
jgi:hypothetical protein